MSLPFEELPLRRGDDIYIDVLSMMLLYLFRALSIFETFFSHTEHTLLGIGAKELR